MTSSLHAPVALIIFKRPYHTRQVFERIRAARPRQLFVIADGPRNEAEQLLCQQSRAIVEEVDWPCDVHQDFALTNLGLRQRVTSGINWLFEHVDEAIILEDDCLPDPTFFRFCSELLAQYRDNPRVMSISGDCHVSQSQRRISYYFSRYAYYWGWATWARAWRHYDAQLNQWTDAECRGRFLRNCQSNDERRFWINILDRVASGEIDSWGYRWTFSVLMQNGLCINPTVNLVHNIGFGGDATHTKYERDPLSQLRENRIEFPLLAPSQLRADAKADRRFAAIHYSLRKGIWRKRLRSALVHLLGERTVKMVRRRFR